jgi:hypothetical protein
MTRVTELIWPDAPARTEKAEPPERWQIAERERLGRIRAEIERLRNERERNNE